MKKKLINLGTTIMVDNVVGIPEGCELIICKDDMYERVKVTSIESPTYKHKSIFHKFLFNLTSKFLLYGWHQPKIISGTLTIERPNEKTRSTK